jgi:hypothetical protein
MIFDFGFLFDPPFPSRFNGKKMKRLPGHVLPVVWYIMAIKRLKNRLKHRHAMKG